MNLPDVLATASISRRENPNGRGGRFMANKTTTIERTTRTDHVVRLCTTYRGKLDTPKKHNKAYADVIRKMADAIEAIEDAWVDPEVVVWMHEGGVITAEVPLSEPV